MKAAIVLHETDIQLIEQAIAEARDKKEKVWDQEILNPVKKKIKNYCRALEEDRCCYCCKNFHGEFSLVMDIEHVLPKSKYGQFELSPFNLSVACKRCNMNIKGDDDSFVVDATIVQDNPEDKNNYKFIHPNLEDYFDHLQYDVETRNAKKMIKYTVLGKSDKGQYTYDYFQLKKLEIDTLNVAQGTPEPTRLQAELMPEDAVRQIEILLSLGTG